MSAQAEQRKAMLGEMVALVGDSSGGVKHASPVKKTTKTRKAEGPRIQPGEGYSHG